MFNKRSDWSQELVRCGASGWRVLSLEREDSIPTGSLPMHFVIPKTIKEADYLKLSNYFRNARGAIWVGFLNLYLRPKEKESVITYKQKS